MSNLAQDGEKPRKASGLDGLAAEAAAGDSSASNALLERVRPRVHRLVRSLLGPIHPDVDDFSQQAMVGLAQALPAFRGDCTFWHYASRIVARITIEAGQRAARDPTRQTVARELERLPGSGEAAPDMVAAGRRRRVLWQLLSLLPEEQAETLALRVVLGFSLKETAEATGAPVNTVRSRVRMARDALKARIESDPALLELLELDT